MNEAMRIRHRSIDGSMDLVDSLAILESVARVEAVLRRLVETRETTLHVGSLELDLIERSAKRGERSLKLLPREFRLLEYMMRRSDELLSRATLLAEVWNYKFAPEGSNLVDVHMGRLRHKIDGPNENPMIYNVPWTGFILRALS